MRLYDLDCLAIEIASTVECKAYYSDWTEFKLRDKTLALVGTIIARPKDEQVWTITVRFKDLVFTCLSTDDWKAKLVKA